MNEQAPALITPEKELPNAVTPSQVEQPLDTRDNPAFAYDTAYAEKEDLERSHVLGKMVTEVEVTPENTPDEKEYLDKKLGTVESQKDYSGELLKAQRAAEKAADIRAGEVRSAYRADRAAKAAGAAGSSSRS